MGEGGGEGAREEEVEAYKRMMGVMKEDVQCAERPGGGEGGGGLGRQDRPQYGHIERYMLFMKSPTHNRISSMYTESGHMILLILHTHDTHIPEWCVEADCCY